jgi:hypothetical protein
MAAATKNSAQLLGCVFDTAKYEVEAIGGSLR